MDVRGSRTVLGLELQAKKERRGVDGGRVVARGPPFRGLEIREAPLRRRAALVVGDAMVYLLEALDEGPRHLDNASLLRIQAEDQLADTRFDEAGPGIERCIGIGQVVKGHGLPFVV